MQSPKNLVVLAILFSTACPLWAGVTVKIERPVVSIATSPGDRPAAVKFTFDDTYPAHVETVVPLFKEFGYPIATHSHQPNVRLSRRACLPRRAGQHDRFILHIIDACQMDGQPTFSGFSRRTRE